MLHASATRTECLLPAPKAKAAPKISAADTANAEELGRQLRTALPPMRVHSVSIYNSSGDVLWLSEGALGPDEHSLVLDAIDALSEADEKHIFTRALDDGRSAIFLAVRAPQGDLVGLAMILADPKSLKGEAPLQSVIAPLRAVLQKIAVLLRVKAGNSGATSAVAKLDAATTDTGSLFTSDLALMSGSLPVLAVAQPDASTTLTPKKVDEVLTFELTPAPVTSKAPSKAPSKAAPKAPASAASNAITDQEHAADLILHVQQLTQLRSGGRTRRYEVLARSRRNAAQQHVPAAFVAPAARGPDGALLDGLVLKRLLNWLGENPVVWDAEPASFSINLSIGALEDVQFLQQLPADLARTAVAAQCIGFEISELACAQCPQQVERFVAACEKIGCFLVLDNFSLAPQALPFLRSPALRLVKIDARLTSSALQDKLSQALVVAIAQACKVLGIHCVAKSVESQAALQWLTGVGCDLAQGFALDRPLPLESLAAPAGCTKPARAALRKAR
jgi:EAL domain-containing protein (putative c-di-GMP-specific phosphodiesterase class I)